MAARSGIFIALVLAGACAFADGPHWQVPNPDSDESSAGDEKPGANDPANGRMRWIRMARGGDYSLNPGNFFTMDEKCVAYYQQHFGSAMGMPTMPGKTKPANPKAAVHAKEMYLLIVQKAAQAMREVETYCPCPDSYPLWQSEELRELMVGYSQKTWIRSSQLPPEIAAECAKICVQAWVDAVRFSDDAQNKRLNGRAMEVFELGKKVTAMLEKMSAEKDQKKKFELQREWMKEANKLHGAIPGFPSFSPTTGDIPVLTDDAASRMAKALEAMGAIVLPPLQAQLNSPNVQVQKSTANLIRAIQAKLNNPAALPATLSNVAAQVRIIAQRPNTLDAQSAAKILKAMGPEALSFLFATADDANETSIVKQAALAQLAAVTGNNFGADLNKWKEHLKTLEPPKPADPPAPVVEALKPAPEKPAAPAAEESLIIGPRKK